MAPQIIFGTASFGMDMTEFQDAEAVTSLLETVGQTGIYRLDTASRYPPLSPGRSEELLGLSKKVSGKFVVDTKIYTDALVAGSGDLTREAIDKSIIASLNRLSRQDEGVNILHSHQADLETPVREQVLAFNEQIEKGRCKAWGVSNVPISQLEEILRVCDQEGLIKPSVYQGEYSLISRGMETELLPLLRRHGMAFNAFRPLGIGFLTGKFVSGNTEGTRFDSSNPVAKRLETLFSSKDLQNAMQTFADAAAAHNVSTLEIAARWIVHHSALQDGDGVILGASKTKQIKETAAFIQKGLLPDDLLRPALALWETVKESRGHIF